MTYPVTRFGVLRLRFKHSWFQDHDFYSYGIGFVKNSGGSSRACSCGAWRFGGDWYMGIKYTVAQTIALNSEMLEAVQ